MGHSTTCSKYSDSKYSDSGEPTDISNFLNPEQETIMSTNAWQK